MSYKNIMLDGMCFQHESNELIIVDGTALIFRAFYGVKDFFSSTENPTNAIHGVKLILRKLQKRFSSQYFVFVFDTKHQTERNRIYPEYKANRPASDPQLIIQIPYIYEMIHSLGIPIIIENGVEADDIIATVAKHYSQNGFTSIIVSKDKDFAQLVNSNIKMYDDKIDVILGENEIYNKFSVTPSQIVDYLSLIGDRSDNIHGVDGCGPKTAATLLKEFYSLENIILNYSLCGKIGKKIYESIEKLNLAKQLITLNSKINILSIDIYQLSNLKIKVYDNKKQQSFHWE